MEKDYFETDYDNEIDCYEDDELFENDYYGQIYDDFLLEQNEMLDSEILLDEFIENDIENHMEEKNILSEIIPEEDIEFDNENTDESVEENNIFDFEL